MAIVSYIGHDLRIVDARRNGLTELEEAFLGVGWPAAVVFSPSGGVWFSNLSYAVRVSGDADA
jgi:hypothetical protein